MKLLSLGGIWIDLEPGDVIAISATKIVDAPVTFLGFDKGWIEYKEVMDSRIRRTRLEGNWIKLLAKGNGL